MGCEVGGAVLGQRVLARRLCLAALRVGRGPAGVKCQTAGTLAVGASAFGRPGGTRALSVGPAGRLRSGAHDKVARRNSLRSLRSVQSDSHRESVYEARCACRPRRCAPRRAPNRPHRAPPPAQHRRCDAQAVAANAQQLVLGFKVPRHENPRCSAGGRAGRPGGACGAPSSAGRVARARSAPQHLTRRRVSERRGRSTRSELRGAGRPTEQRRAVRAQREPRKLRPRACPHTPPPRRASANAPPAQAREQAQHRPTQRTAASRHRPLA